MQNVSIGERITLFREFLGLSRKDFTQKTGISQATISRVESNALEPSDAFLNIIMTQFLANPGWILTGEGEMLIAPEEYIAKGITLLGPKKFNEGLNKIFDDPQFAELRALVATNEFITGKIDAELVAYIRYILTLGQQGDEKLKHWLVVQLERAFPEVEEKKA